MNELQNSYELTETERRFWFEWIIAPNNRSYNSIIKFNLFGSLNVDLFHKAIILITNTEEYLRSRFIFDETGGFRKTLVKYDPNFRNSNSSLSLESQIIKDFLNEKFNIEKSPPWNYLLQKTSKNKFALVFKFHHIMADAFYVQLVLKKISDTYNELIKNRSYSLIQEESINQLNLKLKKTGHSHTNDLKSETLSHWENYLQNASDYIVQLKELNGPENIAHRLHLKFSKLETTKILSFIANLSISPFIFFCSSIAITIHHLASTNKLLISYAHNLRTKINPDAPGCHVNILPIKCDIKNDDSILDIINQINNNLSIGKNYSFFSTADITKIIETDSNKKRWFNIQLNQTLSTSFEMNLVDINSQVEFTEKTILQSGNDVNIRFDLIKNNFILEFEIRDQELSKLFTYSFIDSLKIIILQILDNVHIKIEDLEIISNTKKSELLNFKAVNYGENLTINQLFEKQVLKNPKQTALIFKNQTLSYKELNIKSNQFANSLISRGVNQGEIVAISLDRSFELVICILGIIKLGCAYLPIDKNIPIEKLEHILSNSNPKITILQKDLFDKFSSVIKPKGLYIMEIKKLKNFDSDNLHSFDLITPAYIIYTSGTTGNPKGVIIHHKALTNRIIWMEKQFGINSNDIILHKTPFYFDVSVWELFLPLVAGATMSIIESEFHRDPLLIKSHIIKNSITVCHFIPSMLNLFLDILKKNTLPSLSKVFVSGEALQYNTLQKFYTKFSKCLLFNLYGPTEGCIDVTYWEAIKNNKKNIFIGQPIDNMRTYILSKYKKLLPSHVSGELYIAGIGLALGYLNNKELTNMKFHKDIMYYKEKMYQTGDLARINKHRQIEFLGRIDRQIKLRGHRIELQEIEDALTKIEFISEAAVLLITRHDMLDKNIFFEDKLVSIVSIRETKKGTEDQVEDKIRYKLENIINKAAIPDIFIFLETLANTPNGKYDYSALKLVALNFLLKNQSTKKFLFKVRNSTFCNELNNSFKKFFGINNFDPSKPLKYFYLDSLNAARISINMQKKGFNLEIYDLFSDKNTFELETILSKRLRCFHLNTFDGKDKKAKISLFQENMIQHLISVPKLFNVPIVLLIKGKLDTFKLLKTIEFVVRSHSALRSMLKEDRQEIYQIINNKQNINYLDLSKSTLLSIKRQIYDFVSEEIDIFKMNSSKFLLIKKSRLEYYLIMVFHHLFIDGWSVDIIFRQISKFYNNSDDKLAMAKNDNDSSNYIKFSNQQREEIDHLINNVNKKDLKVFCNISSKNKFLNHKQESNLVDQYKKIIINTGYLNNSIFQEKYNLNIQIAILAIIKILVYSRKKCRTISVAFPTSLRQKEEIENVVGYFVNHFIIKTIFSNECTLSDVILQLQKSIDIIKKYHNIPFKLLINKFKLTNFVDANPQIIFTNQNMNDTIIHLENTKIEYLDFEHKNSIYSLDFELQQHINEIVLKVKFEQNFMNFSSKKLKKLFQSILLNFDLYLNCKVTKIIDKLNMKDYE